MYPYEIEQFLRQRNYYIGGDDLVKVTSQKENPQLNHVKFNPEYNEFELWDKEGHYYKFRAMPYKEALEQGLVKGKQNMISEENER